MFLGRTKSDLRASNLWLVRQARQSPGSDAGRNRKAKAASGDECDYSMCRHRSSHSRPDCRLAKMHERDGIVVTKKP